MTGPSWAALLLLAALTAAPLPLWRSLPRSAHSRLRALVVLVVEVLALTVAGLLAWAAPGLARPDDSLGQTGSWPVLSVVLASATAALVGGGPAATAALRLADPGRPGPGPADPDVLRGGAWVGALERIAVCATVLVGWPEGIAIPLAIKGLGRYPELRAPAAAERFIIGTFVSVLWACGCAAVGWALLR